MMKNNPYIERVNSFKGRLYPFIDPDKEKTLLGETLAKYEGIFCELGSGSGMHLIDRAEQSPDFAFVGFEIRYKRSVRTIEKAVERGIAAV